MATIYMQGGSAGSQQKLLSFKCTAYTSTALIWQIRAVFCHF